MGVLGHGLVCKHTSITDVRGERRQGGIWCGPSTEGNNPS